MLLAGLSSRLWGGSMLQKLDALLVQYRWYVAAVAAILLLYVVFGASGAGVGAAGVVGGRLAQLLAWLKQARVLKDVVKEIPQLPTPPSPAVVEEQVAAAGDKAVDEAMTVVEAEVRDTSTYAMTSPLLEEKK